MNTRKLRDLEVSAIGMGCMGFSTAYGKIPEEKESIRLMRKAHDMGCTFYDTAEIYATYRNEELVGKALKPIRNEIVLSTKYSPAALMGQEHISGGKLSRNGVRFAIESSLKRLQTDHVELYYAHRVPEEADVEEMAEWFGELIREGKILAWVMKQTHIVPIPGMRSDARIQENLGAAEVWLTHEEYATLTAELDKLNVYGNRTDEQIAELGELRTRLYGSSGVHKS